MPKDVVRPGDKSNDVKLVQTRLTELGYLTSKVTGTFDDDSVKALKKFQKANGLDADGVCGIQTRAVLFAAHPVYAVPTATPVIAANETPEPTYAPITKENCVTIKAGSQGMDVKRLQIRLQELGYYTSRQDGIYLTDDIAAVRAFQKANGLTTDGKAGYNTQTVLYSDAAKRADNANSDVIASSKAATLRYGSQGAEVQTLQNKLISAGLSERFRRRQVRFLHPPRGEGLPAGQRPEARTASWARPRRPSWATAPRTAEPFPTRFPTSPCTRALPAKRSRPCRTG